MMTVVDRIYEQVMGSECLATGVNTVNTVVGDILLLKSKVLYIYCTPYNFCIRPLQMMHWCR